MTEVYKLKLQLAEERRSRPGVEHIGTAAVQSGTTAGGDRITNPDGTATELDDRMYIEPMRCMGSESASSPARSRASTSSRNGDSEAVPVQRENDEYNAFRQMLERESEKLAIDWLRTELRARCDLSKEGKSLNTTNTAFLSSGTKRRNSGRRREK